MLCKRKRFSSYIIKYIQRKKVSISEIVNKINYILYYINLIKINFYVPKIQIIDTEIKREIISNITVLRSYQYLKINSIPAVIIK